MREIGPQAFEKGQGGLLVPTRRILSVQQPRPKTIVKETKIRRPHTDKHGRLTDVDRNLEEFGYDEAVKHYEQKFQKSMTLTPKRRNFVRDMVKRAADLSVQ